MWQKILLGVGIAGVLLAGLGLVIFGVVVATGSGHISGEESLPGFLIGSCCCSLSLVVAIVGLILVMKNRKKPQIAPGSGTGTPPANP